MATVPWIKLSLDASWGKYTKAALQHRLARQGFYTRECDGVFGYQSQLALQKWLKTGARRFHWPSTTSFSYYKGVNDGDAGKMTWEGMYDDLFLDLDYAYGTNFRRQSGKGRAPWPSGTVILALQAYLNWTRN